MLDALVPASVVCVQTRDDDPDAVLFPEEERALGRAVDKRRREFTTARSCARAALRQMGVGPTAIGTGSAGEPLWPRGFVGSITHCQGFRAAAVAPAASVLTLGIDAEPNLPLPAGVLNEVAFGPERDMVDGEHAGDGSVDLGRLLFCAKEAVYKAWYPITHRWLGFDEAAVRISLSDRSFRARLLVPGPLIGTEALTEFHGRWDVQGAIVCAAVVVSTPEGTAPTV